MILAKAIQIAATAFVNKVDKGGKPYILHCLWVMDRVRHLGETAMICAVLHDLLEDCEDWTVKRLINEGFSMEVVGIIGILTHDKDHQTYEDYIKGISSNLLAKEIKKRDLEHNTKITRLKGLRKKDFDRLEKYHKAYVYLSD